MNRFMTAFALSALFVAAPAFAKSTPKGQHSPTVGKSALAQKAEGTSGEANAEGEGSATDTTTKTKTKHTKHSKHAKHGKKTAPSEAPSEGTAQ